MNSSATDRTSEAASKHQRRTRAAIAVGSAFAVATLISACASTAGAPRDTPASRSVSGSPPGASTTAGVTVGNLKITGGYIPQQASPDVASAYFTVANTGSVPDTLARVTTNVTSSVMAMNETNEGTTGSMTDLPRVVVPAHGSFRFTQGHAHLMLEKPSHMLTKGEKVMMTITFSRAGTVRLVLPVVGFAGPQSDAPTPASRHTSGMTGMGG